MHWCRCPPLLAVNVMTEAFANPSDTRPYRPCVGIVLLNRDGLVFAARRNDMPNSWQMPQGGIDPGEDPEAAARRELREETGVTSATWLATLPNTLRYDLPTEISRRIWGGRFRGQEQRWYSFRFTGAEAEIDIATQSPEFNAWRWMPATHLAQQIVGFKRPVYDAVFEGFARHLAPASKG